MLADCLMLFMTYLVDFLLHLPHSRELFNLENTKVAFWREQILPLLCLKKYKQLASLKYSLITADYLKLNNRFNIFQDEFIFQTFHQFFMCMQCGNEFVTKFNKCEKQVDILGRFVKKQQNVFALFSVAFIRQIRAGKVL